MSRKRVIALVVAIVLVVVAVPTVLAVRLGSAERMKTDGGGNVENTGQAGVTASVVGKPDDAENTTQIIDDGVTVPLDFAGNPADKAAAATAGANASAVTADEISGRVVLKASKPDANGVFTLTLTAYDINVNVFQIVFSYNTSQVTPVDSAGGRTAKFTAFASMPSDTAEWMNKIGNSLDADSGLVMCGAYMNPGMEVVNAGEKGVELYVFTMMRTGTGDTGIKLATESSGGPYSSIYPNGGEFADAGQRIPFKFSLDLSALGEGTEEGQIGTEKPPAAMTKEERRKGTVILQIGNYAAAIEGAGFIIDEEDKEVVPFINSDNRTLVPVRFVAEALGAEVEWLNDTRQVSIRRGGDEILMTIGSAVYTVNGESREMDTVAAIVPGWNRTVVPIRFVAEALGMSVEWDNDNRLVIIAPPDKPWVLGGSAEAQVTSGVLTVISSPMREFIGA